MGGAWKRGSLSQASLAVVQNQTCYRVSTAFTRRQ